MKAARFALTCAVVGLAILQIILTWDFWGTFGAGSGALTLVFQGIGALLAVIEALALVVAGQAADRGEFNRANVARALFIPLFVINLAGDIGAIATFSAAEETRRDQQAAGFDANTRIAAEAGREAERLRAILEADGFNLPSSALRPQAENATGRLARWEATGTLVPRTVRAEAARLESALATATEMEAKVEARDQALAANAAIGARPREAHPQFEALSTLLQGVGVQATSDSVRVWLAAGVGLAVKLWLAFGLWAASARALPPLKPEPATAEPPAPPDAVAEPLRPESAPSKALTHPPVIQDVLDEIWGGS
ncbi:MAG: hypothetical protein FD160_994 [Caulobacteraceae bacterium]|nr:MAG: hypothetical protein FD160_994 [Caulobacteraceae bacterium]